MSGNLNGNVMTRQQRLSSLPRGGRMDSTKGLQGGQHHDVSLDADTVHTLRTADQLLDAILRQYDDKKFGHPGTMYIYNDDKTVAEINTYPRLVAGTTLRGVPMEDKKALFDRVLELGKDRPWGEKRSLELTVAK